MDRIKVECKVCKGLTNHSIEKEVVDNFIHDENGEYFEESNSYKICKCLGCENICFVYDSKNSELWDVDEKGEHVMQHFRDIFPSPKQDGINEYEIKDFFYVPDNLTLLYEQVVKNYQWGYYILASIGIRMIIEGICGNLDIKQGYVVNSDTGEFCVYSKGENKGELVERPNLEGKINGLLTKGYLIQTHTKILHGIREMGNESAHELKSLSAKVVCQAIEIIEFIFISVYELKKYNRMISKT